MLSFSSHQKCLVCFSVALFGCTDDDRCFISSFLSTPQMRLCSRKYGLCWPWTSSSSSTGSLRSSQVREDSSSVLRSIHPLHPSILAAVQLWLFAHLLLRDFPDVLSLPVEQQLLAALWGVSHTPILLSASFRFSFSLSSYSPLTPSRPFFSLTPLSFLLSSLTPPVTHNLSLPLTPLPLTI